MSFALRWNHENVRMISFFTLFSLSVILMFFMLLYGTATKSVSMVVNGKETIVKTKQLDLQHLLDEQAIVIGKHDKLSADLSTKIKDGATFTIVQKSPVQLTADGETRTVYTTAKTVSSLLDELDITLGTEDRITPSLEAGVTGNTDVKIVRVKKQVEEQQAPIAFTTETRQDANLLKGKEQTVQEGKEGTKVIKTEKVFEDGKLVAQNPLGEAVQTPSVNKIVALGTKNPVVALSAPAPEPAPAAAPAAAAAPAPKAKTVTKAGAPASYKQIINNATLTAYSAGPASTGKSAGMAGYGKTATGTTVTEGRTIAVDPNVIPLGWWVYIDGIGYRRAEDTGSAIKGNKIDVYFDSEAYAQKFGLKRGFTVYVIGPNKPAGE
ncbi:ubiquitin-like domain-containing protein [Paenibacillus aurantius]|uniref:Ubiquitin-like domain-containing protein n=2 Tax=Paenibacillus aurantius TaxID=2918900 RepID=A0AA96LL68_9BACL|nr:ubiquitin-like domain-containing protein [Paenibacillus aurantius]